MPFLDTWFSDALGEGYKGNKIILRAEYVPEIPSS